ncbi:MAG: FMN-binding protein, partial [Planctomycetota bacterium]
MTRATRHRFATLITICTLISAAEVSAFGKETATEVTRTRAEVEALIKKVGSSSPEWWSSVKPTYPPTLDLNWPLKAPGKWNARRNMGQYIWDIINPNPGKWQEGVKLVHMLMIRHKDDPAKLTRSMNTLGRMFHDLTEDWARAAFWWRMSASRNGQYNPLGLAHCYWKLGSREMAVEVLSQYTRDYTRHGAVIKFWAEMGEFDKAIKLAEDKARSGMPDVGYLTAGDACRLAGDYERALRYYEKAAAARASGGREGDFKRNIERARASVQAIKCFDALDRASVQAIKCFDALDISRIADGSYQGSSIAYAGPLYVSVTVKSGRIESVKITKHKERQFYSAFTDTPNQIIARQSVKGVDAVTGATM